MVQQRGEQARIVVELRIDKDVYAERWPLLRRAIGIKDYSDVLASLINFDGAPAYSQELWNWDKAIMAYRYSPLVAPRDRVNMLLSWDVSEGWLFRPDLGDAVWWAPLLPRDDQRNRPDQTLIAMLIMVERYAKDGATLQETVRIFREHTRSRA